MSEESKKQISKTALKVWGFLTISVWLAGGPRIVDFVYTTGKSMYNSVKCELTECAPTLVYPSKELVDHWHDRAKKGKVPPFDDEREFALLLAIKETNGL